MVAVQIIEPGRVEKNYWRDLWRYRELFQVLAWRDIAVRYKQTVIGVIWAVIRPLLTMAILTIVFGRIAKLPTGGVPYPLMVLAGMLPWTFFSTALSDASNSLIANSNLITKVYFPRLIVPAATVATALVDFAVSCGLLVLVMVWYHFVPTWRILFLPLLVLVAIVASLGPGLWVTAFNVKYRDFRYVIPFIVQFGLYVSPVAFSSSIIPLKWRLLYSFNPLVGVIDGFRYCILGRQTDIYWPGDALSLTVIVALLWLGIRQFRKMERTFADII